ncbi:MAG: PHP domain-containing protein [Thermomicrobiales bacterium]
MITPRSHVDLHTHTTASDGVISPAELVSMASRRGITVLGVTDHDTLDGLPEAEAAAADEGLELVSGVELSTTVDVGEFHLLGYLIDRNDDEFVTRLTELSDSRLRRVRLMLQKLTDLGYPVDVDRVMTQGDSGSIGRPHVARELVRLSVVESVNDAFEQFLKSRRPAFVPRELFPPEDAIALVLRNGAIPVLAHPLSTRDPEAAVKRLVPAGLAGIEVYYAEYSVEQHQQLAKLAERYGLVKTGGSDFHGTSDREGRELGSAPVPPEVVTRLREAVTRT